MARSQASGARSSTKRLNLRGCRRQTRQVERGSSQKRAAIGAGRWLHSFLLEPSQYEVIDRILDPGVILDFGNRLLLNRLE